MNWDKEKLVKEMLPVVKRIAEDLIHTLPPNVELDDLIQEGVVALLSAIERYDPMRASFKTFVLKRIKGAMYDYLRKLDWMPKDLRRNVKMVERLVAEKGALPTDEEIAEKTGMDPKDANRAKNEMIRRQILMMDGFELEIPAEDGQPDENALREILIERLKGALEKLSEKERIVLSLRFEKELSLKEIAKVLGVTESRVSQIVSVAIVKLRKEVEGW